MKITYFCLIFVLLIFASMGVNGERNKRYISRESPESQSHSHESHSHERRFDPRMGHNGGAGPLPIPQA
ncbi:unnamed protein product [Cylicocyclus nassatus]|uniref:Uncharacterized protein n=1 Tax=Cylicocyclus nassatus TaxID=53992 RepID=A0AA36H6S6_CYLNA|nr:unnamed protein product [Cylicocyclus nassatus]